MTTKADFTNEEWSALVEGPPIAGLIVITAQHGGMFRETLAMGKAYAEARQQHGASQLLDEIVAAKPHVDHSRYHSPEELKQNGLAQLRDAIGIVRQKATEAEADDYRSFVLNLAQKVASAHRENGVDVSAPEQAAIDEISASLG